MMSAPSFVDSNRIGGLDVQLTELRGTSLEVHAPQAVDPDLISGRGVIYSSLTTVDETGDVEFNIPPDPECYFILNQSRLEGSFVVKNDNGSNVLPSTQAAIAPHYSASLFSQIEIYLNGTQVCDQSSVVSYPFKHNIDTTLSYHHNTINYALQSEGSFSSHDGSCTLLFDEEQGISDQTCACYKESRRKILDGRVVHFSSTIGADIMRIDQYLPPNVDIKIKLKRFNPSFGLLQIEGDGTFALRLKDLKLRMRKVLPSLAVRNRLTAKLMNSPCFIPYEDTQLKQFHIMRGATSFIASYINNDSGKMPLQVVFTFIETTLLAQGSSGYMPFRYLHGNLGSVMLKKNNSPLLPTAMECNFSENDPNFMEMFDYVFSNAGTKINLTPEAFADGKFFLFFDLTPDRCHSFHHHLSGSGNLELDLTFTNPLPRGFTLLTYAVYNASLTIDKHGQVCKKLF